MCGAQVLGRGKPALLIELAVVGQVGLGYNAEELSFLDDNRTIEQQVTDNDRESDDGNDVKLTGEVKQLDNALLGDIYQQILPEKILARIARDRQLREYDNLNPFSFRLCDKRFYLVQIVLAVSDFNCWNRCCDFDKSMLHNRTTPSPYFI